MIQSRKRKIGDQLRKLAQKDCFVPSLLLSGKWMQSVGIQVGDTVNVTWMKGKIVITKSLEK